MREDEDVIAANIILISTGAPRPPGIKMNWRDLAVQNGKIIKQSVNIYRILIILGLSV